MTSSHDPVVVLARLPVGCRYVGRKSSINKGKNDLPVWHNDTYNIPRFSRIDGALLNDLKTPDVDDVFIETGDNSLLIIVFSTPNGSA